jgi:hypothetical protein
VTRIEYANPTGLAGDPANAFKAEVKNGATVLATVFNTENDAGGATLAANSLGVATLSSVSGALNLAAGRLYVAMHPNGAEGSHKNPAAEIWGFDVATKQRVERVEGNNAVSLAVSRGPNPMLFAIDPLSAGLVSYATAPRLAVGKRVDGFGEAPILIETH